MNNIDRYYIKATSDVCYDKTGVTYPKLLPIDFTQSIQNVLGEKVAKTIRWEPQFGWNNQPDVITFTPNNTQKLNELEDYLNNISPRSFLIYTHWDAD